MLDYLSQNNLITLKFPRNTFGLDDDQNEDVEFPQIQPEENLNQ